MKQAIEAVKKNAKNPFWLVPFILFCLFTLDTILSLFTSGWVELNFGFFFSFFVKIIVICLNLFFIKKFFINNDKNWYHPSKTWVGYMVLVTYIVHNIPGILWKEAGLIEAPYALSLWLRAFVTVILAALLYCSLWFFPTQESWKVKRDKKKEAAEAKRKNIRKPVAQVIVEITDLVVQCIVIVLLIQHFLVQPYVVPTGSMIPTIPENSLPVVVKLTSGPFIPMTDIRLPSIIKTTRGQIIAFDTPRYDSPGVLQRMVSDFVYKLSFTRINLDLDLKGNPVPRNVVKRLIGMPGEKIMIVDDKVYITKSGGAWVPLGDDGLKYAHLLPSSLSNLGISNPDLFLQEQKTWDGKKNSIDINAEIQALKTGFKKLSDSILAAKQPLLEGSYIRGLLESKAYLNLIAQSDLATAFTTLDSVTSLADSFKAWSDKDLCALYLTASSPDRMKQLERFFTVASDIKPIEKMNLYEISSRKLNLLYKKILLETFVKILTAATTQDPATFFADAKNLQNIYADTYGILSYTYIFDFRNMPEFPKGDGNYIPANQYFLMGDNRYGSLDFRYKNEVRKIFQIDAWDDYSLKISSMLNPFTLSGDKMLGLTPIVLWPLNKAGLLK